MRRLCYYFYTYCMMLTGYSYTGVYLWASYFAPLWSSAWTSTRPACKALLKSSCSLELLQSLCGGAGLDAGPPLWVPVMSIINGLGCERKACCLYQFVSSSWKGYAFCFSLICPVEYVVPGISWGTMDNLPSSSGARCYHFVFIFESHISTLCHWNEGTSPCLVKWVWRLK